MTSPVRERRKILGVTVFTREEFCRSRFWYKPGQHVLFAGPTQRGKTTLAFNLLEYTATPEMPVYVAVCKPNDPVTAKWGEKLGYRRVTTWPPPPAIDSAKRHPAGYLIWPMFGNVNEDVARCAQVTRALLEERYASGAKRKKSPCILMLDDTVVKSKILKLDDIMTTHLAMAGAMKIGGWYFVQKPTGSGQAALWSYGMSEHTFLFRDPDKRNRMRYDEIGGVDPRLVSAVTQELDNYQCLYIQRDGARICIVDKD